MPDGNGGGFIDRNKGYDYTTSSYAQTPNDLYSIFTSFDKELETQIQHLMLI